MRMSVRGAFLWMILVAGFVVPAPVSAQVDPECDTNNDNVIDDAASVTWDYEFEQQQYLNLLNFYAVTLGNSPLHSPAPLDEFKVNVSLELNYIPQLGCLERGVFYGSKTENTNKSVVLPRPRVTVGLPFGFYAGLSGIPPVTLFGVTSTIFSAELGYGHVFKERIEAGARATFLYGKIVGDLAGPFGYSPGDEGYEEEAVDDLYATKVTSVEAVGGYRIESGSTRVTPYLGVGFTHVAQGEAGEVPCSIVDDKIQSDHSGTHMCVGEDLLAVPYGTYEDTNGDDVAYSSKLYSGPHFEIGAQARIKNRIDLALEAFMIPLNMDPGNPRFFFSPRLRLGYTFF